MKNYKKAGFFLVVAFGGITACQPDTEKTENDTITVTTKDSLNNAEKEFVEFREWARNKTTEADTSFKAEFRRRSEQLDTKTDQLSEKTRAEYNELKQDYKNWGSNRKARLSLPLDTDTLNHMQQELLSKYKATESIPEGELKEAYVYFMQQVRNRRSAWSASDWDYVNYIYRSLNARKEAIQESMATSDKLKITTLQAEYLTFETASDARDLGRRIND